VLALLLGVGPLIAFLAVSVSLPSASIVLVGGLTAVAAVLIVMPGFRTKPFYDRAAASEAARPIEARTDPAATVGQSRTRRSRWRAGPQARRSGPVLATKTSWSARQKGRRPSPLARRPGLPEHASVVQPSGDFGEIELLLGELATILRRDLELIRSYERSADRPATQLP
jgi:hypothetical protein